MKTIECAGGCGTLLKVRAPVKVKGVKKEKQQPVVCGRADCLKRFLAVPVKGKS